VDILELTDRLHHLFHSAKQVPLSNQLRVNRQEIREILDQMRATLPGEIREAGWIAEERGEMLAEAKREAERTAEQAREHQTQLVTRHELIRQAEHAAEEIIEGARAREQEIRLGAEDYADETLNTLELNLATFIAAIRRGRELLRGNNDRAEIE